MIERYVKTKIKKALDRQPAVAIIGARQVGKTTLAINMSKDYESLYLDLESSRDRQKITDPHLFFEQNEDRLIVLDEIHKAPELFQNLRGIIDEGRRKGLKTGRFLLLGSASMDLLRQSGESLAGRISYINMTPLTALEIEKEDLLKLWVRGGFPDSFMSQSDEDSYFLNTDFIKTYLEREIFQFARQYPSETLERLWMMFAHNQGGMLNLSKLASNIASSTKTVGYYVDLFVDLLLFRKIMPYSANIGKRLVKTPKFYIRDSGMLHTLLGIQDLNSLLGHPIVGQSFEGFVIENILSVVPPSTLSSFYRTFSGAEIDLILELPHNEKWAIEIKSGMTAKPSRGFYEAIKDIKATRSFIIYAGEDRFPLAETIEAIGLRDMMTLLTEFTKQN